MVLFLFVIMLLSLGEAAGPARVTVPRVVGGLASAGLFALLVVAMRPFVPVGAEPRAGFGTLQSIGAQLYTQWLAPFEAVSLLLLVAMVGAVVVAKSRV
jgi:NADH-quinone oxidoreductase subunit J